ncbi:TolC family protein [Nemorincola caseinilytica]|uniref:TolC family protein n=1 Tax=Nemorincola caseinilytica TaxID=2054315 RepID=A0ABP8N8C9_9BACT
MNKYILLLAMLVAGGAQAQERLTLQDAIARTLQHNFDIQIANVAKEQAIRNNTLGNAGFSPSVAAGVTVSGSRNNVQSDLANGSKQNNPNAVNTNVNPVLTVNWTIFDGGRMFLVKKQLNELEALGDIQLKTQMQTMVSRTIQMYAQVTLQQKRLIAVDTALRLSQERLKLADLKYRTGAGAKFDYVTALVDLSARRDDSLTYLATFAQACDSLSVLMGTNEGKLYRVDDSLQINMRLQPTDKDRLRDINLSLSAFRRSADISHISADIARTYALPTLTFNGGYIYSRSTSATGFALFSQTYGANGALNLSVPLFMGGNIRRQARVASLQAMRDELLYERQNTIVGRQYRTAWRSYTFSIAAYRLANDNIGYAKEAVDIQSARFKLGAGTTLELRQAENDYVLALIRLYTAEYNVKVNETQVLELENKLVQTN